MEIYDYSSNFGDKTSYGRLSLDKETTLHSDKHTYLDLRKLFVKRDSKIPKKGQLNYVTGGSGTSTLLPLNSLNATLTVLYSIDYIRKILKKKYISNTYSLQHYGINLFPNFLNELSNTIFHMNKIDSSTNQLERFYQYLLKYDPSLSSYSYNNLYVS